MERSMDPHVLSWNDVLYRLYRLYLHFRTFTEQFAQRKRCQLLHRDAPCLLEGHIPGRDGFFGKKVLEVTEEKSAEIQFQTGTSMLKSRPGDPEFLQTLMLSAQRIVYLC